MKKLILLLIALIFLAVSCNGSKKAENDNNAVLPDEDVADENCNDEDDDEEYKEDEEIFCGNLAHTDGTYYYTEGGRLRCGCLDGYSWTRYGCKKITPANICTGNTICYSSWERIECRKEGEAFYGQDAQYAKRGYCIEQDFSKDHSVSGETTVRDNNLKIEWMLNISDSTYTWNEAVKYCEDLEYGGYDDWRLPSLKELMFAAPLSKTDKEISLWAFQTVYENNRYAWIIYPKEGRFRFVEKSARNQLRCVRGEPVITRTSFQPIDKNLILDRENGLMWSTANYSREQFWEDALPFCEKSTAGGFSDWRLPNINELSSLLNFEKKEPYSDFPYPENKSVYFWSSTTLTSSISESPGLSIYPQGDIKNLYKPGVKDNEHIFNYAICVRDEPCREYYFWNGNECVESPCKGSTCAGMENSDGICHLSDSGGHFCGCKENYFWDGVKCTNPCDADPCKNVKHSDKKCKPRDDWRYTCGCADGYYWWGQEKGCLDRKPGMAHLCTGQTKCFDNEKEIECPAEGEKFYGQDAQYADFGYCAPKLYTVEKKVEDEPVVIDEYTGLSWQQKVYVPEKSIGWSKYKNYCENSNYGGYDDWRLPSVYELKTIMDFGKHHPNVDPEYFPNTPPKYFVTSTYTSNSCGSLPHITTATWVRLINFDHFETDTFTGCSDNPPFKLPARCVRGEANPASTWSKKISEMETVYVDSTNGVMLTALNFYAPDRMWEDAFDVCENMTYAGFSDWRLPNIWQLILYGGEMSSTTEEYDPSIALSQIYKDVRYEDVRCIRDNPCEKGKFWFNEKCIENPCLSNPCNSTPGSKRTCRIIDEKNYSCTCEKGTWSDELQNCVHEDGSVDDTDTGNNSDADADTLDDDHQNNDEDQVSDSDTNEIPDADTDETPDADTVETPDEIPDEIPDNDSDQDIVETPDSDDSENGETL